MKQTSQESRHVQVGPVKSCKKECKLDKDSQTCTGCGRTIEEIKEAGRMARPHLPSD